MTSLYRECGLYLFHVTAGEGIPDKRMLLNVK